MAETSPRERLLTFLLLPAFVVAVLVLDGISFRNSFQLEKLREQSVVEATLLLANEKADRLEKRIIDQDNLVTSTLDLDAREDFASRWLASAKLQTPTVRSVMLVDLSSATHEVLAVASRFPGLEDERFRRLMLGVFIPEMRLENSGAGELRHLHRSIEGQSYLVSYWQTKRGERSVMVVAWHDVGSIIHHVFPELYPDADQTSRVNVVDAEGRIVYGQPLGREGLTLGRRFETTLYKWRLNVTMASARSLAAAVSRRRVVEMVLVGLSGLVVIAGSVLILVAAARERKLSNLKSDFVANVSHELKTPLSLVKLFGELLQSGRADTEEKRAQYLQIIVTESERLAALIENVLDFAKVERGKAAYEFVGSSVSDVVARACDACRVRAEREQIVLTQELAEGLPDCPIDTHALEIAVINLIDNAVKYAAESERIEVSLRRRDGMAEIRVRDYGAGIPVDEKRRIFERFARGKNTGERRIRGSGIGLALVKHIAEAHGGRVWVEDAEPRGACFVLSLSLRRGPLSSHDGLSFGKG